MWARSLETRRCSSRGGCVVIGSMIGQALAKDAVQEFVEQAQPASGVQVEELLAHLGAVVLDAVAVAVDRRRDDLLASV